MSVCRHVLLSAVMSLSVLRHGRRRVTVEAYLLHIRKDAVRHNPFMLKLKNWIKAMQKPYCNCAVKRGLFSVVFVRE